MSYAEQEDLVPGLQRKIAALEAENAKLKAIVEAVKKLRVITPEEIDNNKPFWVIPCDSYKPLKIAMDELEGEKK